MHRTRFDPVARAAAVAAALAVGGCATAKPAPVHAPVKPMTAQSPAPAPAPSAVSTPAPAAVGMPAGTLSRTGGVVVSADSVARSLTIKDYHGRTRIFRVAGAALLTKGGDGAAVEFDDIAAGDRVQLKVGGDVVASAHVLVKPAQ